MIQPPGQPSNSALGEGLALPRPNLGPEPMDSGVSLAPLVLILLAGGLIVLAVLVVVWRRWSSHRTTERTKPPEDDSPEARLLALRERARTLLASRFGPALRARTTEELAVDAQVAETLGEDALARLTDLLRAGDRVLFDRDFATETDDERASDLAAWSTLLDALSRSR